MKKVLFFASDLYFLILPVNLKGMIFMQLQNAIWASLQQSPQQKFQCMLTSAATLTFFTVAFWWPKTIK